MDRGQYKLSTSDAVYSFGKNYKSFKHAFNTIDWEQQQVKEVLVLGYGLGSITSLLEDKLDHNYNVIGVDVDKISLDFSQRANQENEKATVDLVCKDAIEFLELNSKLFDVICVDIFVNDKTPTQFTNEKFLKLLLKNGRKGCLYLFSRLNLDADDKAQNLTFQNLLAQASISFDICDTGGNNVYIWSSSN